MVFVWPFTTPEDGSPEPSRKIHPLLMKHQIRPDAQSAHQYIENAMLTTPLAAGKDKNDRNPPRKPHPTSDELDKRSDPEQYNARASGAEKDEQDKDGKKDIGPPGSLPMIP
jgi:hypothetical protein